MTAYRHVALIGVGLLGGSIGSALRRAGAADRIVGYGRNEKTLARAVELGVCDETTTDLATAVRGADAAVVCTPVQSIAGFVLAIEPLLAEDGFVTDVGSVKGSIVASVESARVESARVESARVESARVESAEGGGRFVGSHPMAGSEKTGVEHSRADLFDGALTFVTPSAATDPRTTQRAAAFWESLGCRVEIVSPAEHDQLVAATSHVPHLVASALAASTPGEALAGVASGWKDATRIASGDVELWRQIVCENRSATLARFDAFLAVADSMRRSLASGDDEVWIGILEEGKRRRDAVGS